MANSVDPDQTAPVGAVWSGSTLFAQIFLFQCLEYLWYIAYNRDVIDVCTHLNVSKLRVYTS